ncbi:MULTISPECIES: hypothetical protein [unclassified Bradyrhizobium]|uniref:hypothetical protein n=1 Tax=unclassified Bradyrhizobium TaxID=2631580 RepID=UPI00143DDFC5|nr:MULTISPECIES: hypothetical protein [unclassified Bradyrhizobium]
MSPNTYWTFAIIVEPFKIRISSPLTHLIMTEEDRARLSKVATFVEPLPLPSS